MRGELIDACDLPLAGLFHAIQYLVKNNKFIINIDNHDIYRNKYGIGIIPDSRNDHNYIVCQMHLLFQLFHNKLIDYYSSKNITHLFEFVKREVIFHYQWIIMNEYLPKIVDNDIIKSIIKYGNRFFCIKKKKCIPKEFLVAAFRFGHFTINNKFQINSDLIINQEQLHTFVNGLLPDKCIDWCYFFNVTSTKKPQPSKKISIYISKDLSDMKYIKTPPNFKYPNSLLLRDLLKGKQSQLPSGQSISNRMNIKPICKKLMKKYDHNCLMEKNNFLENTPLLLYILKESEIYKKGLQLTGVGGIIVAEVILSILCDNPNSYINASKKWYPSLPSLYNNEFKMADLIRFVYSS